MKNPSYLMQIYHLSINSCTIRLEGIYGVELYNLLRQQVTKHHLRSTVPILDGSKVKFYFENILTIYQEMRMKRNQRLFLLDMLKCLQIFNIFFNASDILRFWHPKDLVSFQLIFNIFKKFNSEALSNTGSIVNVVLPIYEQYNAT